MLEEKTSADQAVEALYDYLKLYWSQNFRLWAHDQFGTEFHQGRAHALTGLALIPEVRAALDPRDEQLGKEFEQWHPLFTPSETK